MAGMKLLTKTDAQLCLKLAFRAAQDLGFSVTPIEDTSKRFTATKGSALLSAVAGPFAPHCDFQISVEIYPDMNEIIFEMNKPWLTSGAVGVRKVKDQGEELVRAIASAIEKNGGAIMERKEIA